ncbi:MAG: NAD-dependent succinate-semialdehyde dehydrogenase [Aquisalimonadaceae bacterium]
MALTKSPLFREHAYIDGEWVGAGSGATFPVHNPATMDVIAAVPDMDAADTRRAIAAAEVALPAWRATTARARGKILRRWQELMLENQEYLATLMTSEQGKPLAEARGEIGFAAAFVDWFAEEGKRVYGDMIPSPNPDWRIAVIKQPVGVCAAITPWNFPSAMITRKAAAALAAGCTMVIKPAEDTPLSALALAELAEQAGVPPGVLNVVTGSKAQAPAIGSEFTDNPTVRKITFTGSTGVGRLIMEQSARQIKRLSLELGGHAPFIVFDDADIDAAVAGAMASKFRNSGQTCVSANRFYVQEGVYDAFAAKLAEAVGGIKVGYGFDDGVTQGPLINQAAVEKVERHIGDATGKGARVLVGGGRHTLGGSFFEPTVLADMTSDMVVSTEETFGPLAPLYRFRDEREVVGLANASEYGLAGYFYSRDIGRIWRVAEALDYGLVGVNAGVISVEVAPFGGMKQSGLGREGSKYGIEEYVEIKYVCLGGIQS